ncbi:hypothetical protein CLAFUW4_10259 [Fulvia fulva]|nr:hypothetical protein CLAFUR4_10263 [Fulvia fulva]KAK4617033.1 hypothetical protein CLAFUR0_10261 [Fulvia fulva]WPV19401.1 hypothetical protein CLAFUW4_10259 [Fulvia fulva]WPV34689.1 hypothetical protein CLAFUW7_10259 [Fulvia fulva]
MEKVQMIGFFLQKLVLSSIYIVETVKLLRSSLQEGTRKTMKQLVFMNVVIIVLDLGLLGLESASLYIMQIMLKGVVYSVKPKLEFAILGKLVQFVRATKTGRDSNVGFITTNTYMSREEKRMNIHDFVDSTGFNADVSNPMVTYRHCTLLPPRRKSSVMRGGLSMRFEYKLARFEHIEHILTLPLDEDSPRDSLAPTFGGEV